ncbi:MAG: 4Fe-4S dicluster domain-containing protein, partial [Candidatus Aminicenantes bacterium]|nr:4Fe-4S dicluster domain-containing protein [Candidatus Aminicenantes bacterium]
HCMRACPTHAIRVKGGKARVIPELCIDCGNCLAVCPTGAITATTLPFTALDKFKFKVVVASPALFAQFGPNVTPAQVGRALLDLGFDAVWEYAVDIELIDRAISKTIRNWPGPFPLISNSCPVVVRLVQVAYPAMVDQVISVDAPREIAARELKRRFAEEKNLKPEEIAAVYITPCQAKTISIIQPAEGVSSHLDGTVAIKEIYNDILFRIQRNAGRENGGASFLAIGELFHWGTPEGEFPHLLREHYLPLTGLQDVIKVFDDIEKGKLRNIEFLECHACPGGCIGGNLTVENIYAARSKLLRLSAALPRPSAGFEAEVARRCATEDLSLRGPLKPRRLGGDAFDLRERVLRKKRADELMKGLPGLNCGLCGAPSCRHHAEDVAAGWADVSDCVFLSRTRIDRLRRIYVRGEAADGRDVPTGGGEGSSKGDSHGG